MFKKPLLFITVVLLIALILIVSCSTGQTTPSTTLILTTTTQPPVTTTPITTTSVTTTPVATTTTSIQPAQTAGELAVMGKPLYNKSCTYPDCHAEFSAGIEFNGPDLSRFTDAETVFNIISDIMHLGVTANQGDIPSENDYLKILAFLLVQDNLVQPEVLLERNTLHNILLDQPPVTTTPTTTTSTAPTTPVTTSTPTQTTTVPTVTWGELASRGERTFLSICAPCHGDDGQGDIGPSIIGSSIRSYQTAFRLLAFISTNMPQDGPGSLSTGTYQRILAYILTESGFVQPDTIFNENELNNIPLE